jgi:hypothetical protein
MKAWNEFFNKETNEVNEHHKTTRDEQVAWICETMEKLSDEQIKEIYDFMEEKLDV